MSRKPAGFSDSAPRPVLRLHMTALAPGGELLRQPPPWGMSKAGRQHRYRSHRTAIHQFHVMSSRPQWTGAPLHVAVRGGNERRLFAQSAGILGLLELPPATPH